MAYIAAIKILVDEANEANVYDGINEMLRSAQYGGPNGEDRGWIVDWKFESVDPANESVNASIARGSYKEGDAFDDRMIHKDIPVKAFNPFRLVIEAYTVGGIDDRPSWAELTVTEDFLNKLQRMRAVCEDAGLDSVSVSQAPDKWDREEELGIEGDTLKVWPDHFWFEANSDIETRMIDIDFLIQVAKKIAIGDTENPLLPGFMIRNGIVFYGESDLEELVSSYEEVECSECGARTKTVIGCPDGAEICGSCFNNGAH
ncbi:hypothetical protein [Sulfuricystis multivorans]|uniref:hypothetical protein n=1 Tax=Sulfuricystis multivorans TaxID=2211108 RepID=UPI000F84C79F|nr:hypothetical protein [Sulfuricystis multivorans]